MNELELMRVCCKCKQVEKHGRNKVHKSGISSTCLKCRSLWQKNYHENGKGKKIAKIRRDKAKIDCFNAYGGCKCVGCGENDIIVLSIDHIEGGGNTHRKEIKAEGFMNIYFWLRAKSYPTGYRVLCMNCQFRAKVGLLVLKEFL